MLEPLSGVISAPATNAWLPQPSVNAPSACVAAGPPDAIERLERDLAARGITARRLHTSHAFHSAMMEPVLAAFRERVAKVAMHPPRIRFVSNVTGTWITDAEATDTLRK